MLNNFYDNIGLVNNIIGKDILVHNNWVYRERFW